MKKWEIHYTVSVTLEEIMMDSIYTVSLIMAMFGFLCVLAEVVYPYYV